MSLSPLNCAVDKTSKNYEKLSDVLSSVVMFEIHGHLKLKDGNGDDACINKYKVKLVWSRHT